MMCYPTDVIQGPIANNSAFLACLSGLAKFPDRIAKLFPEAPVLPWA